MMRTVCLLCLFKLLFHCPSSAPLQKNEKIERDGEDRKDKKGRKGIKYSEIPE